MLEKISTYCMLSWGLKRFVLVVMAGALSSLALPPIGFLPVLFITFPALVWFMDGHSGSDRGLISPPSKQGFYIGWCFGFGYFLASLYWIGAAFLVEADVFAWAMPLAIIGLPAFLALFWGGATFIASMMWQGRHSRVIVLAICMAFSEYLRGTILTGFPWNTLGLVLTASDWSLQSISLLDMNALSFLVVIFFASPALIVSMEKRVLVSRYGMLFFSIISLVLIHLYGWQQLRHAEKQAFTTTKVRVVHPSIPQREKMFPEDPDKILQTYLDFSDYPASDEFNSVNDISVLVWPESAFPFFLSENIEALNRIGDLLPETTNLITGAARVVEGVSGNEYYNSIYMISGTGKIESIYDKIKLVPFGEYLPLQGFMELMGLKQLTKIRAGFKPGQQSKTMSTNITPAFLPLICFEIIFTELSNQQHLDKRPKWIVNVTNDAWFGRSIGPYQHFHQARVRAVEQGLPVVRSANLGISAIIDGYGRVLVQKGQDEVGTVDSYLPEPLPITGFEFLKNSQLPVFTLLGFIVMMIGALKRRKPKE